MPGLDTPFGKEILAEIQPKSPLVQLEDISTCPSDCYLQEEINPSWLQAPFR